MATSSDTNLPQSCFVVVPAFNEAPRIGRTLESLLQVARSVVVVDDGSADNTAEVALQYPVWVLRHPVNLGQGAAIQTGITFALRQGAEYVATFDADGQHDPGDLAKMLEQLHQAGVDYVLGSRFLGRAAGIPISRKLMLKAAVWYTRLMSGIRVTDTHNGIRLMTRRGAERIHITMNRMEHASEILDQIARSGLRFIEVPVTIRYSEASLAKGQKTSAAFRMGVKIIAERVMR
ncbi:MAG: glycosyltransferase family 2 protein [Thermogutta sp.]|uniref:glycosyltransferase family 2 protein n=1 Tax=Thermogutta sp. TaxID=1962930 RepID=UPI0019A1642A|nr:glycosyltransferase family 2 protein [Thermogutta sp.]MBC7353427.1 glycosyltransferase family 2 protein [Thermogutta sp.]